MEPSAFRHAVWMCRSRSMPISFAGSAAKISAAAAALTLSPTLPEIVLASRTPSILFHLSPETSRLSSVEAIYASLPLPVLALNTDRTPLTLL